MSTSAAQGGGLELKTFGPQRGKLEQPNQERVRRGEEGRAYNSRTGCGVAVGKRRVGTGFVRNLTPLLYGSSGRPKRDGGFGCTDLCVPRLNAQ